MSCAVKTHFFPIRGKKRFYRLAAMPFPDLFHDGPPKARLRSAIHAFLCHWQRRGFRPKKVDQRMFPLDFSRKWGI